MRRKEDACKTSGLPNDVHLLQELLSTFSATHIETKLTNLVSRLLTRVVVTDDIASLVRAVIDVYNLARAMRNIIAGTAHRSIFDLVTNLSISHSIRHYTYILKKMNILCIQPF